MSTSELIPELERIEERFVKICGTVDKFEKYSRLGRVRVDFVQAMVSKDIDDLRERVIVYYKSMGYDVFLAMEVYPGELLSPVHRIVIYHLTPRDKLKCYLISNDVWIPVVCEGKYVQAIENNISKKVIISVFE